MTNESCPAAGCQSKRVHSWHQTYLILCGIYWFSKWHRRSCQQLVLFKQLSTQSGDISIGYPFDTAKCVQKDTWSSSVGQSLQSQKSISFWMWFHAARDSLKNSKLWVLHTVQFAHQINGLLCILVNHKKHWKITQMYPICMKFLHYTWLQEATHNVCRPWLYWDASCTRPCSRNIWKHIFKHRLDFRTGVSADQWWIRNSSWHTARICSLLVRNMFWVVSSHL